MSVKSYDIPYKFFIGVDHDDDFFIQHEDDLKGLLEKCGIDFELIFVENPDHKPCPVWNNLFEIAYNQGYEYFLQTGDDIQFLDPFDREFIDYIESKDNLAIAGGVCDVNASIITQVFLHRSHMDVFGFLFPPELPDWGSDNWITATYTLFQRANKSQNHKIKNSMITWQKISSDRYVVSKNYHQAMNYCFDKYKSLLHEAINRSL
jgi:hypothetical protein